jgi:hypothetical protein
VALDLIEIITQPAKETAQMKFLMTISAPADPDFQIPPEMEEEMGQFIGQQFASGHLIDTGGLAPLQAAKTVRLENDEITVIDGPFAETKEVLGGYALMQYDTLEEAVEGAREFIDLHRRHLPGYECHTEIRQVFGPEDAPPAGN